jgi:hypothetical protein
MVMSALFTLVNANHAGIPFGVTTQQIFWAAVLLNKTGIAEGLKSIRLIN